MVLHYNYCPVCGEKLRDKIAGDDGPVPFCHGCNQYWFDNFHSASIVLIYNEFDEIALSYQGYLSDKYATFTSGYITPGETAEQTALREAKEELGIDISNLKAECTCWFDDKGILMHGFTAFAKKQAFTLSSEVDRAQWVPSDKVGDLIFPDKPGNCAWELLRIYRNSK